MEMQSFISAYELLGLEADATTEAVREAYLQKVRQFPPDKAPGEFERIRQAYDLLKAPGTRERALVLGTSIVPGALEYLESLKPIRRHTLPGFWLSALKEP